MTVADHFRVKLGGRCTCAAKNEPLCVLNTILGEKSFCLKRNETGALEIETLEIYDESGNHVVSVRKNHVVADQERVGLYSVTDSTDELSVRDNRTGDFLVRICRPPNSKDSVEVHVYLRLHRPGGGSYVATPDGDNFKTIRQSTDDGDAIV